jgi:hypothetical protein
MNNPSNNFNGNNTYDLWVREWLCTKDRESESDSPLQNICDNDDLGNLPSVASVISTKYVGIEIWDEDK